MKSECFVTVSSDGVIQKFTKKRPKISSTQIAFKLKIEIPDEFFNAILPEVKVAITKDMLPKKPTVLTQVEQLEI